MADFFDRLKDGINKGVATVSTGSKTVIEKTKINTVIKGLEDEKKQLAEILGNKVHKFCMETTEGDIPREECIKISQEIVIRDQQIALQRQKIEELDAEMNQVRGAGSYVGATVTCVCGHPNALGAKFCAKCGTPLN